MRNAALLFLSLSISHAELAQSIRAVTEVQREGQGNAAAAAAWKEISAAPAAALPELLLAMDTANPLAENWLRAAISAMVEKSVQDKSLPVAALKNHITNTKHSAGSRSLAFDILLTQAPSEAEALSPTFLDDPSAELRRHPIAKLIAEATKALASDKVGGIAILKKALNAARDEDQIKPIAKQLRDLGEKVDLPTHFGFLMDWKLIAPFNNKEGSGHDTVYPPENELDLSKEYEGKGKTAKWTAFTSTDDYGKIDFNKPFGMEKEVTGYATTDFISSDDREAQIRLGCKNAWKVWLNGELLFARDEYHRGAKLDQYTLPCTLRKGKNTLLVKCSQNHQTEEWTVEWEFQLRICDATGTAIKEAAK